MGAHRITISHRLTACIDSGALLNPSEFVRSIKRGQIVMWLISARALDKVGPSICVFSASIGRIMHNTGLIVASRITVRAIPVVVIEMNGMPMARNFPFGQKYQLRRGIGGAWASLYSPT